MIKKLKKIAIVTGLLFAGLFTLYVLWASWENWTGARAWEEVRTMLEAEKVPLELKDLVAEPVPAEENFFATPLLASLLDFRLESPKNMEELYTGGAPTYVHPDLRERFLAIRLPDPESGDPAALPHWSSGSAARLDVIRRQLDVEGEDASAILDWMAGFETELAEIDAAAKRPASRIRQELGDDFLESISLPLPFLSDLMNFQKFQAIRACAALEIADRDQARATVRTMLQVSRAARSHPTLIGYLVGVATLDNCLSVIWHGMERGQWSADDLQWIQRQLSQHDVLEPLEHALTVELVGMQIGAADYLKGISLGESRELVKIVSDLTDVDGKNRQSWAGMLALVGPSGIWDHNKAFGCRLAWRYSILPVRERRIPDTDALTAEFKKRNYRNFLATITLPAVGRVAEKGYQTSVALDLARLACAVEQHHLETGAWPESLEALVPKYIDAVPDDLFRPGKSLQYEKGVSGDRYRLWSVGKNGTDDGGAVVFRNANRRDLDQGDWAWGYAFEKSDDPEPETEEKPQN